MKGLQGGDEALDVLAVPRINDIDIIGRMRQAMKNRSPPANYNKINTATGQNAGDFLEFCHRLPNSLSLTSGGRAAPRISPTASMKLWNLASLSATERRKLALNNVRS